MSDRAPSSAFYAMYGVTPQGATAPPQQSVEELKREIERLRLKLFWRDHSHEELQAAMAAANGSGPKCACLACAVSGRKDGDDDRTCEHCTFKPWFEALLKAHAIVALPGPPADDEGVMHEDCAQNVVYDADCHLMTIGRHDWVFFTYGARLWKAASVEDPELRKLAALFDALKCLA